MQRALKLCPDKAHLMQYFGVAKMYERTANEDACYLRPDLPTLKGVLDAYGHEAAAAWVYSLIVNAVECSGARKEEANLQALEDLARNIPLTYPYLNPLEVLLFFRLFKGGKFGKFYGNAGALTIADALRKFNEQRHAQVARVRREREAAAKAREEARNAAAVEDFRKFLQGLDVSERHKSPEYRAYLKAEAEKRKTPKAAL